MNMAYTDYQEQNSAHDYTAENERSDAYRGGKQKINQRRRTSYARAGSRPSSFNGIHRRRNKRFSW
jgi:hypothetical protein